MGMCSKRGCKTRAGDLPLLTVCFCRGRNLSGVRELYVIADGAPVTVTLKLLGSESRSHIRASGYVPSQVKSLEARVEDSNGRRVYSVGDFTSLSEPGFGFVGLWAISDPHAATAVGECLYYGDDLAVPETVAFLPGCPTGHGHPSAFVDADAGRGGASLASSALGDLQGLGGWYTTAGTVKRSGAVALWLQF